MVEGRGNINGVGGEPEGTAFYKDYWKEYRQALGRRQRVSVEHQDAVFTEFHSDFLREIFSAAPGRLIANLGCGKGTHSIPMEHRGFRVVNADFSVDALVLTRDYYESQGFKPLLVRCDIKALPFKTETFDIVMNFGVMEHFHDIEVPYREMYRILKPKGVFQSEVVTKRFSLYSIELFIVALLYLVFNLVTFRLSKVRGLFRSDTQGHDFFENSYPLTQYEKVISELGVSDLKSVGVRPCMYFPLPPSLDKVYSKIFKIFLLLCRRRTTSGSRFSKRWCPVWLLYGIKQTSSGGI